MKGNKAIVKQALSLVLNKGYTIDAALEIAMCHPKQLGNCRWELKKALERQKLVATNDCSKGGNNGN